MNNPDRVARLNEVTLAEMAHTSPNWAINNPQKKKLFEKMISSIRGLLATKDAVAPVNNKAVHIQMYTLLTKVFVATAVVVYDLVLISVL